MQRRVTILCICVWAGVIQSLADTIHLKNGRTIVADHVRENGTKYEYEIGDDSYAIPKSAVDYVTAGGAPARGINAEGTPELPVFSPPDSVAGEGDLLGKVVKEGKVNSDALTLLENKGNAELSATAEFIAGKYEFEHGNMARARAYFENALRFQPQNSTVLIYYSALLVRSGNASRALAYAQEAVQSAPNSADAYAILGYAQSAADRTKDAVSSWKRSLELRPDSKLQKMLEQAQREQRVESEFSQGESSHFIIHYEGRQSSEALRGQIVAALESDYDDLVRDLGAPPRDNIAVTLYTEQAFFDVTNAPAWSGAINDGKLRIPLNGLSSMTPELAHVLRHELAHSFVTQLSAGRCPMWLHEGIAQMVEPRSLSSVGPQLSQLFKAHQNTPLNALEGSFLGFSGVEAYVAYAESLAAVSYINDTYGMSDVQRILQRLSEGNSTEAALRATIHSDYGQLQSDLARYLADRYGD
jgi:tetratricopeptide (TPR) repeat protein